MITVCILLALITSQLDTGSQLPDQSPIKVIYDKETGCDLCAYSCLSNPEVPGFTRSEYRDICY